MSRQTAPIDIEAYKIAVQDVDAKKEQDRQLNSKAHLQRSNEELQLYLNENPGDKDCMDALAENETVLERINERLEILEEMLK